MKLDLTKAKSKLKKSKFNKTKFLLSDLTPKVSITPYNINLMEEEFSIQRSRQTKQEHKRTPSSGRISSQKNQQAIDDKEKIQVGIINLFRFSSNVDRLLIILGSIGALVEGVTFPLFALLWGQMMNNFSVDNQMQSAKNTMVQLFIVGIVSLFAGWTTLTCWMVVGVRQGTVCRREYLKSLLKQQIAWFDMLNQEQLAIKFSADCLAFQGAVGEKMGTFIMSVSMLISAFSIAFYYGWVMTLATLSSLPLLAFGGYLYASSVAKKNKEEEKEYLEAGGLVEQAFSSIRTIKQLNGEQYQSQKYNKTLKSVKQNSKSHGVHIGIGMGTLYASQLLLFPLVFWYGTHCVQGTGLCPINLNGGSSYQAVNVLVIFFSLLITGLTVLQLIPAAKKIVEGKNAAKNIFSIIDRKPRLQSPPNAIVPSEFKGLFKFENVSFAYPKNKSAKILNNLNIDIKDELSVALAGESGCGKSTIFQLIMRFYDPDEGTITLDGIDLKDLELGWLRRQIGYVGQQPMLFTTTIKENLLLGNENATDEDIEEALRNSESFSFIESLPDRLDTFVGNTGGQISGGQKQRLVITRELLKKSKLLLLDEATSALDRRNEKLIQNTLNTISKSKKTINIAHRLRTIMNCDKIFVLEKGSVSESGKFKELKKYKDSELELDVEQILSQSLIMTNITSMRSMTTEPANDNSQEDALKKKEEEELLKKYEGDIFTRLFSYVSGQKCLLTISIILSLANGLVAPIYSIFLADMLSILFEFKINPESARIKANETLYIMLAIAGAEFFIRMVKEIISAYISEEMTEKIRKETYEKILRMPISWFDKPKNVSGALSSRLSSDCHTVNSSAITYLLVICSSLSTLLGGLGIAFYYEWRTTLVSLGLLPIMIFSGAVIMMASQGFSQKIGKSYEQSSNLITQSIKYIRTVTSFGSEDIIVRRYGKKLVDPEKKCIKSSILVGFVHGISRFSTYSSFALIFFFGVYFMTEYGLTMKNSFSSIYSLLFIGMVLGNNIFFMPDLGSVKKSAVNIFEVLDGCDEDQLQKKEESTMLKLPIKGQIEFKNVTFKYPSREQNIFKNLSFTIKKGQKIGFVGPSGCGKSTIHQMLQRFYDPDRGQILIDGFSIKDYDIHHLRSSLGVVSQEPVLFNDTIENNIRYNKEASQQEVVKAANLSNYNPEKDISDTSSISDDSNKNKNIKPNNKSVSANQSFDDTFSHPNRSNVKKIKPSKSLQIIDSSNVIFEVNEDPALDIIDFKTDQIRVTNRGKRSKADQRLTQGSQKSKKSGTGFNKNVGVKGSHISGGQKQRVAIARVILRKPHILLLDEATSALDSVNEKKVQQSLDDMMEDKTSITIAHRMETIKNSDLIMAFQQGKIVQSGSYKELMAKKGYFYGLEKGHEQL